MTQRSSTAQPFQKARAAIERLYQHEDDAVRREGLAALNDLWWLMVGLTSYAMAAPTNAASEAARDQTVAQAKEALGITDLPVETADV